MIRLNKQFLSFVFLLCAVLLRGQDYAVVLEKQNYTIDSLCRYLDAKMDSLDTVMLEQDSLVAISTINKSVLQNKYWATISLNNTLEISAINEKTITRFFIPISAREYGLRRASIKDLNSGIALLTEDIPYYLSDTPDKVFMEDKKTADCGRYLVIKSVKDGMSACSYKILSYGDESFVLSLPDAHILREAYPNIYIGIKDVPNVSELSIVKKTFSENNPLNDVYLPDSSKVQSPSQLTSENAYFSVYTGEEFASYYDARIKEIRAITAYMNWRRWLFSVELLWGSFGEILPPWTESRITEISISQLLGVKWLSGGLGGGLNSSYVRVSTFSAEEMVTTNITRDKSSFSNYSVRYYLSNTLEKIFDDTKCGSEKGRYIIIENKNRVEPDVYIVWDIGEGKMTVAPVKHPNDIRVLMVVE